jgi:hypothetical protein
MKTRSLFSAIALAALLAPAACTIDPVHSEQVSALGPEQPGVPRGPLHRAGQPCLTCHGGDGPASMVFSVAGTVYEQDNARVPFANALVKLTDSAGHHVVTGTNCAGNFFLQPGDFTPSFPMWVAVSYAGQDANMNTPVFRDGSCAGCHVDPRGPSSPGHVYFQAASQNFHFPASGCP